jgi:hypothetical protein
MYNSFPSKAEDLLKQRNYSKRIDLNENKVLIIHQGYLDQELLSLVVDNIENKNPLEKTRGVASSVPIASAITSYGRMEITKYLLMDDLKVHYIVTDGITINKKLPNELVSNKLGAMKLEYEIKEGIIISVNTLAVKTKKGETIIKNKGFKSTNDDQINYNTFTDLLEGKSIELNKNI